MILESPYNFFVSTKAHFYYGSTYCMKDVWRKNNKCMVGVGNSYMDWHRDDCSGQLYFKCFPSSLLLSLTSHCQWTTPPPSPIPQKILSIFAARWIISLFRVSGALSLALHLIWFAAPRFYFNIVHFFSWVWFKFVESFNFLMTSGGQDFLQ